MATKDNMWLCKRYISKECRGNYNNCVDCVLDKIRAEIKALSNANPSHWHSGDMVERDDVLEILDKFKAESEDKE